MHIPSGWFPLYFVVLWFFASFILSRFGWIHLSRVFGNKMTISGIRLGWFSMKINWINYKNCIVLHIHESGIFLKPLFFFRLFHPPVFIPWEHWCMLEERTLLGKTRHLLYLSAPSEVTIPLNNSEWKAVSKFMKNSEASCSGKKD